MSSHFRPITKHITQQLEPYLDDTLSVEGRRHVEEHAAKCPACAYRLFTAQRMVNELGPVMKQRLGQPSPPGDLRERVRLAVAHDRAKRRFIFPWMLSGQILNAVGTVAVVGVLTVGVFAIVQGQAGPQDEQTATLGEVAAQIEEVVPFTPTPLPDQTPVAPLQVEAEIVDNSRPIVSSLGDTILIVSNAEEQPRFSPNLNRGTDDIQLTEDQLRTEVILPPQPQLPSLPGGTIAFAQFDPTRRNYDTYFISPIGTDLYRYPLAGVSEPAIQPAENGAIQVAYRAWGEPTSPRSLTNNNLDGDFPQVLTNFWEDAQPDWSPIEDRIIFASQRESDRYWRLYTVWGDGSSEVNLRREGRSPTFAPDGYRFAFESCDSYLAGTNCGLWLADLDHSEYEAYPFLLDPLAKAPDWSPRSETIAYMANPDDNWDIYLVDSEGQNIRRLTNDPAIDGLPTWSPDGKWLLFLSDRGGQWGLWLLHVETGHLQSLYTYDEGHLSPPQQPPFDERHWWDEQLSWSE